MYILRSGLMCVCVCMCVCVRVQVRVCVSLCMLMCRLLLLLLLIECFLGLNPTHIASFHALSLSLFHFHEFHYQK